MPSEMSPFPPRPDPTQAPPPYWELGAAARLAESSSARAAGNASYGAGDYEGAVGWYERALSYVEREDGLDGGGGGCSGSESLVAEARAARLSLLLNAAAASLKLSHFTAALDVAGAALALDPGCARALYRRAQAKEGLADVVGAIEDALAAARAEPQSREARELLARLRAKAGQETVEERARARRMMVAGKAG
eukprot:CAMPEP_0183804020 /NCGR_PEP_ID=MMETSP0803_2-20130417/34313_1 /TAXON_ID=195967 /ORGANISM="Crustomastix stigmata, Strain CCMP3273" /LENGTH=193 /DNA_ID=CAMNT_0026048765 /DNA_START=22 /DNA_END=599 /DNA_ORIENTATION=+